MSTTATQTAIGSAQLPDPPVHTAILAAGTAQTAENGTTRDGTPVFESPGQDPPGRIHATDCGKLLISQPLSPGHH